jgi:hypothetical protein
MRMHLTAFTVSTSWLSFGTARRRVFAPSHFERGLKPARPGLSLGVFRRFGTMAYIHAVASPNEVLFSATLYYRILIASREEYGRIWKNMDLQQICRLWHCFGVDPIHANH